MIKKIIPREIQKAFIVAVLVFIVLFYWGGRLMYGKTLDKIKKCKVERERVVLENRVGRQLNLLQKVRGEIKTVQESSRFLAEIAKIAGQMNMKLRSISALPMEKHPEFVKLNVGIEVDTKYHELGLFISKLEGADLFIIIEKIEIVNQVDKENIEDPRVFAKINSSTMYLTDTILEK
ncbi:MAG: type 4a pilus biogenesis protein PilO [Candidatus Omnitrophica bacterium]|nr:type 4a pilus biogenesis protein PilO [Candidatus Omnitrophota bacterium]MBU4478946.1 type 4a pilus biogenesis protein PilO [Candidatus Omnitrophota bacterium]MCG2704000.1 type 4a pilus biogenesis protein PilO [Candidatus Omnitrophota bacterium]